MKYPIAPNGIFTTIQGEGGRAGEPMVFVRLAGCSVGCPLCDTDYRVDRRLTAKEILDEIMRAKEGYTRTVWITGGEPMDHDLLPLLECLETPPDDPWRLNVCLATSGHKEVPSTFIHRYRVWLSVSPHRPNEWKQMTGDELKIVPQLAGHSLAEFFQVMTETNHGFRSKWACPCDGRPETVKECRDFVCQNATWRMGGQLHKQWGIV